jgi:hypothetical protein
MKKRRRYKSKLALVKQQYIFLKFTPNFQQSNVDSGADRSRIIKENDILTGFSVEEGETTTTDVEGISFPLERQ